jgi:MFS family permease
VVATVGALLIMDRFGRKTLLAWSAWGMAGCCFFLTLSLLKILPPIITVLCVLLYISFFEVGLGCIPFFLASELIQPQFLGTVQSMAMASNWFSNFCVGLLFPAMDKYLGAYSFVPFAPVLVGTGGYAIWVLPETRGKSLDMVLAELREQQEQQHHELLVAQNDEISRNEVV